MKKKKLKYGDVKVQLHDIAYESFSDMSYFMKWAPEGSELIQVQLCHEFGQYDEGDAAYISIEWKEKE